jgi:hypothetical protein
VLLTFLFGQPTVIFVTASDLAFDFTQPGDTCNLQVNTIKSVTARQPDVILLAQLALLKQWKSAVRRNALEHGTSACIRRTYVESCHLYLETSPRYSSHRTHAQPDVAGNGPMLMQQAELDPIC